MTSKPFRKIFERRTSSDRSAPCASRRTPYRTGQNGRVIRIQKNPLRVLYPLVMTNITIENGHRNSGFTHWKWWFSIAMWNYQRVGIPFSRGVRITSSKHRCNEAPDATAAVNSFLIGYLWNKDIREHDQQKYRLLYSIPIQRRRLPNCYPSCVHSRELWAIELSHHLDEQGLYTASVILFHDRRHLRRLHAEWNIMKHHDMAQVAAQIQSPSCGTNHDAFTCIYARASGSTCRIWTRGRM